jgi:hypothetical protein
VPKDARNERSKLNRRFLRKLKWLFRFLLQRAFHFERLSSLNGIFILEIDFLRRIIERLKTNE